MPPEREKFQRDGDAGKHGINGNSSENTEAETMEEKEAGCHYTPPERPQEAVRFASSPGPTNARGSMQVEAPRRLRHSEQFDRRNDGRFEQQLRGSKEFDRRYDGPFGRPSLAMARREGINEQDLADIERAPVTTVTTEPPSLNYELYSRARSISFFWTLLVLDSVAMPIAVYYGLWYGVGPGADPDDRSLDANAVFSIVTAAIGGTSIAEYFLRFWRLWRKGSTCRVLGARRWYLDWFHWNFSFAWIIVMIELIVGTVPKQPPIRLLSMPLTTMLYVFGTQFLIIDTARYYHVRAPLRISSVPKNAQLRPAIYFIIEDVCAVDGGGGVAFRSALNRRYEASHVFRVMLRRLGLFWAIGAEGCAIMCTILIFSLNDGEIGYVIGWSVPFVWAGIWATCTVAYVKGELKKEKEMWTNEAKRARV